MTFFQLSIKLSESKINTPLYSAIDRQMKKIIAKDQSKINRVNIVFGAVAGAIMAGIFAIIGVLVGHGLENKDTNPESCQKTNYSKLQENPKKITIGNPAQPKIKTKINAPVSDKQ